MTFIGQEEAIGIRVVSGLAAWAGQWDKHGVVPLAGKHEPTDGRWGLGIQFEGRRAVAGSWATMRVISSTIVAGSDIRPGPTLRQASQPSSGPMKR